MHESAAPWRALEDQPVAGTTAPNGTGSGAPPTGAASGRLTAIWIGLAIIAAIAIGMASWLVVTGGTGSVTVVGDSAALFAGDVVPTGSDERGSRAPAVAESRAAIVVDVQGAIVRPGIVRLPAGSRVGDAIAAAGGFGPRVATDRVGRELNLAAVLTDGDKVVVPSRDDPLPLGGASVGAGGGGGALGPDASPGGGGTQIDLNSATAAELDGLPGVGPVTAAKIIAAREEQPFTSVDDLRTRGIVGPATFDKIRDLVVVR